ncbi:methyl-accepting chemotaxis sensory transducer [Burkholderiales bacterium GJ-E10]|nr:methyl-accepting chemotaxis sensory transducer [Burkholderiales bacterium GJ-E10]
MSAVLDIGQAPAPEDSRAAGADASFFRFHGIWAPGVRVFRQLHFGVKAVIISAAFVLPTIAMVAWDIDAQYADAVATRENTATVDARVAHDIQSWLQTEQAGGRVTAANAQDLLSRVPESWTRDGSVDISDLRDAALRNIAIKSGLLAASMLLAGYLFLSFYKVMDGGLKETRRHLHAMTAGDLTTSPSPWGKDDAAELMLDLKGMQDSLRAMVLRVRSSSEDILHSSAEIASGAQDLSARTEQAASNLEESAASMEEIASTVRSTSDHTLEAAQVARHNAEAASRGGEVMHNVVVTMEGIHTASVQISEIIGTIDGIAFQTNILALNAAVEAARAGEQGRGFAVVAGEVRMLAQRSAEAAREIKALIGASMEKVEAGTAVVRDAGDTIRDIVASSDRVNGLLEEISSAAREQTTGVAQVGQSVQDLDRMTQQNAALVEETAAAAATMRGQALDLQDAVSRFRLPATARLATATATAAKVVGFDFDQAIAAHRDWKVRLRKAIAGHETLDADTICRDDRCALGKWIHGPGAAQWGQRPGFAPLQARHAEFHEVAGGVARKINAGQYADAERLIGSGSRFATVSTEVATLLTQAKRGL